MALKSRKADPEQILRGIEKREMGSIYTNLQKGKDFLREFDIRGVPEAHALYVKTEKFLESGRSAAITRGNRAAAGQVKVMLKELGGIEEKEKAVVTKDMVINVLERAIGTAMQELDQARNSEAMGKINELGGRIRQYETTGGINLMSELLNAVKGIEFDKLSDAIAKMQTNLVLIEAYKKAADKIKEHDIDSGMTVLEGFDLAAISSASGLDARKYAAKEASFVDDEAKTTPTAGSGVGGVAGSGGAAGGTAGPKAGDTTKEAAVITSAEAIISGRVDAFEKKLEDMLGIQFERDNNGNVIGAVRVQGVDFPTPKVLDFLSNNNRLIFDEARLYNDSLNTENKALVNGQLDRSNILVVEAAKALGIMTREDTGRISKGTRQSLIDGVINNKGLSHVAVFDGLPFEAKEELIRRYEGDKDAAIALTERYMEGSGNLSSGTPPSDKAAKEPETTVFSTSTT